MNSETASASVSGNSVNADGADAKAHLSHNEFNRRD